MILVGSTGFVGKNLIKSHKFDSVFHSTDVEKAYYTNPDIMIYAGVPGTKFLANKFPEKDQYIIESAKINIEKINAKKLILISTIDVNASLETYETDLLGGSFFGPYGNNRLDLEKWVEKNCVDYHIIRLPAIYGCGLKKNFIYDLINVIPAMLSENIYEELYREIPQIQFAYQLHDDGLYYFNDQYSEKKALRGTFLHASHNAYSYTNPDSNYQYYNLGWLWKDIQKVIAYDIRKINLVTEPINSKELYHLVYNGNFDGNLSGEAINYNLRSKYYSYFMGDNGYLYKKDFVMEDLIRYIKKSIEKDYM